MKLRNFSIILGVLLLGAFAAAGNLVVSSVNYEPTPAMPGIYVNLWVHVTNSSDAISKNAVLKLRLNSEDFDTAYPFSLEAGDSGQRAFGTVLGYQTVLASYKILVDPKALDGNYTLYAETSEDNKAQKSLPVVIRVVSRKPTIALIGAFPEIAEIGKTTDLKLTVKNTGSSNALSVSVTLSEDRTVTSTGVVVERDLVPLGAATKSIQQIAVNDTAEVSIPILINPTASSKAYFVPVKIEFYDENKNKFSQTDYVGLKVFDNAEIGANVSEITPALAAGKSSEITVDIYNTGIGAAKFLVFKASSEFAEFKQSEFFIGSLESDDSDSIKLEAKVNANENTGQHFVTVELAFKNEFGEEQKVVKEIPVMLYSAAELASQGQQDSSSMLVYAVIIIVIAAAAYWFLKRKAKGKK